MKKINVKFWSMVIVVILAMIHPVSGQTQKALTAPVPQDLDKIFMNSCMPCHFNGGKMMAMGMVNFSKWTDYSSAKAAKKASMICYVLTKEKMPPKKVRKEIPESIPSKEQRDLICKWADSLKAEQKNP
jgi:hypothetical protein